MEKLPYLFFGSPPLSPVALEALTKAEYPPTKIIDDPQLPLEDQLAVVEEFQPTFFLVVGYGAILKRELLDTVAGQVLNIHPSLLPAYRGPAPVVQAILDGARETGVTLMEIDEKMDHGPIIAQEAFPLRGNEYPEELYTLLTVKGVDLFLQNIEGYLNETVPLIPQNHLDATFTHFIKKEDGLLDLKEPAVLLERKIRAYQGWPRAWLYYQNKRLIIEKAHIEKERLLPDLVQPEGKKLMEFREFAAGLRKKPEEVLAELYGLSTP